MRLCMYMFTRKVRRAGEGPQQAQLQDARANRGERQIMTHGCAQRVVGMGNWLGHAHLRCSSSD